MPEKDTEREITKHPIGRIASVALVAAAYFATAKLGLSLAFVAEQVTAVWPPTGVALASLMLLPRGTWIGIFAGAFLANVSTSSGVPVALTIACGNTLEAVVAVWALRRFGVSPSLDSVRDVLVFVVVAALGSTLISATVGSASLCVSGLQPWDAWPQLWSTWWVGDAIGAVIVGPLVLVWLGGPLASSVRRRFAELSVVTVALAATTAFVFEMGAGRELRYPTHYIILPLVGLAAMRFRQHGSTLATFVASAIAIWATVAGHGPFAFGGELDRLLVLQFYMGVVAFAALLLAGAVSERDRADRLLRERAERLMEEDRRKDEFLAMLAHELRNPLAPITAGIELLERDPSAKNGAVLNSLLRQARHLGRIVDDLLEASRIVTGKIRIESKTVPLNEVVAAAVEGARPWIDGAGQKLRVHKPEQPVALRVDPDRLVQILVNLLNNASKFSAPGASIELEVDCGEQEVVFRVRDYGHGLTPDESARVFELFAQGEQGLDRRRGGLGIGLTIADRLVRKHGGTVEAASPGRGQGSTFTVRLPATCVVSSQAVPGAAQAPVLPGATTPGQEIAETGSGSRRILVVDDNRDGADILAMLLSNLGHDVRTLNDGVDVAETVTRFRPHLVLLDIGLPGKDGYAVASDLRRQPTVPGLRIVAMTGYGDSRAKERAHASGFDEYLVKPVDAATLQAVLDRT